MAYTKYKEIVLSDFAGGLNTKFEPNKIEESQSPDLQNVVFDGRNSIQNRRGMEQFGQSLSSLGISGITTAWCINKANGEQVPVIHYGTSASYYNDKTAAWETLRQGFTRNEKVGHCYYASLGVEEVGLFGNQVDTQYAWHPSWGQLSAGVSASATVFHLSTDQAQSALGWLSAGSGVINGDEFYYGSLSANALSAIARASNASNQATQVGIAALPVSATNTSASSLSAQPHGYIMHSHNGRIYVGGVSGNYQTIYYSRDDDPYNYNYSTPASSQDGGFAYFPGEGGQITSIASKEDQVLGFTPNTVNSITYREVGNVADFPTTKRIGGGLNMGAINNTGTVNVENDVFYVSPLGGVRTLSRLPDKDTQLQINQITKQIEPTINELNLTSAAAIYYYPKYYMAAATSTSEFNNTVLVYDYIYDSWTRFTGWNASDWFIYKSNLYYGSSNELTTYKALTDYDDNDQDIVSHWKSKEMDFEIPHELKRMRYVYIEGYMTQNCQLSCNLYYNGETDANTKVVSGTGSFIFDSSDSEVFGQVTYGQGTYGGADNNTKYILKKFRGRLSYDTVDFFNMQMELKSQGTGQVWKVTHLAPYVEKYDGKKFPTARVI